MTRAGEKLYSDDPSHYTLPPRTNAKKYRIGFWIGIALFFIIFAVG